MGDGGGEHGVLDVVQRPPLDGGRDLAGPQQRDLPLPLVEHDHAAVEPLLEDHRLALGPHVVAHQLVLGVQGDPDRLGRAGRGHLHHALVVGVEHAVVLGHLGDDLLDLGQIVHALDAAQPQVVRGHVEHGPDVALAPAEPRAHDAAAGGLQHRRVDRGVAQHDLARPGAGHVAADGADAVDVDAVRGRHPHLVARELEDVPDHAGGGGLPVRPRDRREGDAEAVAAREEHVDHRPGDVARLPLGGREVHAEAGRGVDLDDRSSYFPITAGDVRRDEVDAADVEADRLDSPLGHHPVVLVDGVGPVGRGAAGRQVAGQAQVENLSFRQHGVEGHPLLGEQAPRLLVHHDAGQHLLVADAAPGVAVDLLDQLGDGAPAVPHHVAGDALGHGGHAAVDHQDAVVVAGLVALDDHPRADPPRLLVGLPHLLGGPEVDRHRLAVMAVERLDHHREAEPLGLLRRLLRVADDRLPRHGEPELLEDALGQPLVGGDLGGDLAGLAGEGRLDALLVLAVAELHERSFVEADPGDVPLLGGAHQGGRRGAEGAALGELDECLELLAVIERRGVVVRALGRQDVADEAQREVPRRQPDLLFHEAVDDVVLPLGQMLAARLAEGDRRAGEDLELDGDVLQHVPHPGPLLLAQAAHEAAVLAIGAAVLPEGGDHLQ